MTPPKGYSAGPSAGPLAGIRVIDLTTTFMGPYATMQMARLGADVIKVEEPSGDVTRGLNDRRGRGLGPIFLAANHGKRSIVLDLKQPAGHAAMLRLVETADVFVSNVRPKALERLGLDATSLRAVNDRLVYVSLVGFAPGGRYSDLAAYDDVIQAVSGMASVQGGNDAPTYVKSAVADKAVGALAYGAIVTALLQRTTTGTGSSVMVPMFESLAAFNLLDHQGGLVFDPPEGPSGYSRHATPFRKPYRTRDGYIGVVVYTDRMWLSFFDLIGRPELADEVRFRTIRDRTQHIDELYELVENELLERTSAYWLKEFADRGIPAVPVNTLEDVLHDQHLADVGFFDAVEHPTEGAMTLPRHPIQFSDGVPSKVRPAPGLGQHTAEILAEIGMPDETGSSAAVEGSSE